MQCPRCAHDNRPAAKFCEECGTALAARCAGCGSELSPTAKFCAECGRTVSTAGQPRFAAPRAYTPKHLAEKIITSRAALEGERKHVTVLFADLKGSLELLADRDPEEARQILISAMGLGLAVRISRLAEACLLAGRAGEALEHARSAVDLARRHRERANEAIGLRVLAEVTAGKDRPDAEDAGECYARGLALAEELGMRPLVARCHHGLGTLYRRAGKRGQARESLATAVTMFTDMGMTSWLERAQAEAATL